MTSRFESNEAIILIRAVDDTNEGFVTIDEDHKIGAVACTVNGVLGINVFCGKVGSGC